MMMMMMMMIITIPLFTLGSINFIAQTLVGPSKCLKQTIQIGLKRIPTIIPRDLRIPTIGGEQVGYLQAWSRI